MYTPEERETFRLYLFNNPSLPEQIMLKVLKGRYNFVFQPNLFNFLPDFYFPDYKVILEIDGKRYHKNKAKDKQRDAIFFSKGIRTLRIPAKSVFRDVGKVLKRLDKFLGQKK